MLSTILIFMYMSVLPTCNVSASHVFSAGRDQQRVYKSLELELQVVLTLHVGAGKSGLSFPLLVQFL